MALTNSVNELTSQHLVSGVARFAGAMATILKLTVGSLIAITLAELVGLYPEVRASRPQRRLAQLRDRLQSQAPRPQAATVRLLQRHALHLQGLARSLEAVSPLATVGRGYAILLREDGRAVRSVDDAQPGDRLEARLRDGRLQVRVEGKD